MAGNVEWTQLAEKALSDSVELAKSRSHGFLSPIHLASSLFSDPHSMASRIATKLGAAPANVHRQLSEKLQTLPTQSPAPSKPAMNPDFNRLLNTAEQKRLSMGDALIAVDHLMLSLPESSSDVEKIFSSHGMALKQIERVVQEMRGDKKVTNKFQEANYEALSKYAIDLCSLAEEGKIDPVIGRDDEIRRTIQILARRTKNNPCLIGEAGTGKSAIVEGLAHRIIRKDIPESLNARIYSLDIGALLAGASYRGQFEERLKSVLAEVKENQDKIILFIDEIHLVVGAGKTEGAMDASNLLKPMLARGELRTIGATTLEEYRKYIEKDSAFERRFQPVYVKEPSVQDCITILRGIKEKYELHHRVTIGDSSLVLAAQLADRYIPNRFNPDKSIDLMDEACASVRVQLDSRPEKIDQLERRRTQLEIERKALEKEKGDSKKAQERLKAVVGQIQKVNEELLPLAERYEAEKHKMDELDDLQAKLEEKKRKLDKAERTHDMDTAADLRFNAIPLLEDAIGQLKQKAEEEKADQMLQNQVTEDDIAAVVARWTGVPVTKLTQSERERLLTLSEALHRRVKGQNEAIDRVAEAVLRSRAGLSRPHRPTASFLFVGTTGTGKSETAKALAAELYDSEKQMVRLDMSEYMESHSVARLIGAPPGYVGHDEGGLLTEPVRRRPHSVILLDEVEKAHPQVMNVLLQVLDDARLTDSQGRTVDFSNTVVILTSNLGSQHLSSGGGGGDDNISTSHYENVKHRVMEEVRKFFRPEFLNRLDDIVLFKRLGKSEMSEIVQITLADVNSRLKERGIVASLTSAASDFVLQEGYDPDYGARPLKRWVEKHIVTELSKLLISGALTDQSEVNIDVNKQKTKLVFVVRRNRVESPLSSQ